MKCCVSLLLRKWVVESFFFISLTCKVFSSLELLLLGYISSSKSFYPVSFFLAPALRSNLHLFVGVMMGLMNPFVFNRLAQYAFVEASEWER